MIRKYILSFFCILLLSILAYIPVYSTPYHIREDLSGIWRGQDQSTYYVRQFPHTYREVCYTDDTCDRYGALRTLGNDIMWVGLSPDDGKSWANVFVGKFNNGKITGTWVDVPRGKTVGSGTLTLEVGRPGELCSYSQCFRSSQVWENPYLLMSKIGSTGSPFGTSSWYKPSCPISRYSTEPDQTLLISEKDCGWDKNLSAKVIQEILNRVPYTAPGGPPLRPPPEFGK